MNRVNSRNDYVMMTAPWTLSWLLLLLLQYSDKIKWQSSSHIQGRNQKFREFLPSLWSLYFSSPFSFPYPILSRLEVAPQIQLRDSGSTVSSQAGKNNIGSHWLKFPGLIKYIKMRLRPSTDEFLRNQSQGTKSLGCKCRPRPISANRNLKIKSKCGCVWMYTPMHVTVCIR